MAYYVSFTKNFNKDVERCRKRGYNMAKLRSVLDILSKLEVYIHSISHTNYRVTEMVNGSHISPDWLLVWKQNDQELTLLMLNTGTHSDLF